MHTVEICHLFWYLKHGKQKREITSIEVNQTQYTPPSEYHLWTKGSLVWNYENYRGSCSGEERWTMAFSSFQWQYKLISVFKAFQICQTHLFTKIYQSWNIHTISSHLVNHSACSGHCWYFKMMVSLAKNSRDAGGGKDGGQCFCSGTGEVYKSREKQDKL